MIYVKNTNVPKQSKNSLQTMEFGHGIIHSLPKYDCSSQMWESQNL